jgi:hypothetical protein
MLERDEGTEDPKAKNSEVTKQDRPTTKGLPYAMSRFKPRILREPTTPRKTRGNGDMSMIKVWSSRATKQ